MNDRWLPRKRLQHLKTLPTRQIQLQKENLVPMLGVTCPTWVFHKKLASACLVHTTRKTFRCTSLETPVKNATLFTCRARTPTRALGQVGSSALPQIECCWRRCGRSWLHWVRQCLGRLSRR